MCIRPRGIAEVYWVGAGVLALLVFRLIPVGMALNGIAKGRDVYFFLVGMMLLAELAREYGVFDWLAAWTVDRARGSSKTLFALVYGAGTLVTIFMSNDATAVVLTPAILVAAKRARVDPLPYLFACAASFVLPISNPANLVVYGGTTPALLTWLAQFALPSAASIVTTYLVLRWIFREPLQSRFDEPPVDAKPLTRDGRIVMLGLALLSVVLLSASAAHLDLGIPTFASAVIVTVVTSACAKKNPISPFKEISWSTIGLVAGLFVLVDAVESIRLLDLTGRWLARIAAWPPPLAAYATSGAVAVANNVFNNLPVGLVTGDAIRRGHPSALLGRAALLGVDLGPNLSVTGSLATILWLLALRKENVKVSFRDFLKVGVIAMPVALVAAVTTAIVMSDFEIR